MRRGEKNKMGLSKEIVIRLEDGSELGILSDRHVFYDDYQGKGNDFLLIGGSCQGRPRKN